MVKSFEFECLVIGSSQSLLLFDFYCFPFQTFPLKFQIPTHMYRGSFSGTKPSSFLHETEKSRTVTKDNTMSILVGILIQIYFFLCWHLNFLCCFYRAIPRNAALTLDSRDQDDTSSKSLCLLPNIIVMPVLPWWTFDLVNASLGCSLTCCILSNRKRIFFRDRFHFHFCFSYDIRGLCWKATCDLGGLCPSFDTNA